MAKNVLSKMVLLFIAVFFICSVKVNANAEESEKIKTQITLNHSVGRVGPSSPYSFIITKVDISLTDVDGNVLEGKEIVWETGVQLTEKNTVTDSKGISSSGLFIGHTDRTFEYQTDLVIKFLGDEKYSESSLKITLNVFDVGYPTPIKTTPVPPTETPVAPTETPAINSPAHTPAEPTRMPTPDVKRKPGPTEVDMVFNPSGQVVDGNVPVENANVTIEGSRGTTTDSEGIFSMTTTYTCGKLIISKKGYITRDVQLEYYKYYSSELQKIELFAGDINADAAINMLDVLSIAKCFNCSSENKGFDPICDMTNDKAINMADVMVIAKNFGRTSEDYDNARSVSKVRLDLTIDEPKDVTSTSVFLKGGIYHIPNGYFATLVWIEYWEESSPNDIKRTDSDFIFYSPDFIARDITGLKPSTKYCFRVKSGMSSSVIGTFSTLAN